MLPTLRQRVNQPAALDLVLRVIAAVLAAIAILGLLPALAAAAA